MDKTDVITSYRNRLKAVLETTACGLDTGFNVYDEDDLRAETTPTSPYIYVIGAPIRPTKVTLPFIGIQVSSQRGSPVEMGRANGAEWEIKAHVFGRSIGQKNSLSGYISDPNIMGDLAIYDVTTGSLIETAVHFPERRSNIPTTPASAEDIEGSWRFRDVVTSYYQTVS